MGLGHRVALATNEEGRGVILSRMGAGDKSVEAFDFMRKPMAHEKIQRAVDHGGLRSQPLGAQDVEDFIGTHGTVFAEQDFQHAAADGGELQLVLRAMRLDGAEGIAHAALVIVRFESDRIHLASTGINLGSFGVDMLYGYIYQAIRDVMISHMETPMPIRFLTSMCLGLSLAGGALADAPKVATDIAPVQSLVARVMQGVGAPEVIVRPGASPHGYAMRPSEAVALEEADLVFWMGEALTPWLEGAIGTLAGEAHVVELLGVAGSRVLPFREGVTFDVHGHDAGGHEETGHEGHGDQADSDADAPGDGHAHDGADPHAWLDPANARVWLGLIAGELAEHDPANAALYAANAEAAEAELVALTEEIAAQLAPVQGKPFLVFHDAYQYFETAFDIPAAGAIALSDAAAPGPARIAALREMAEMRSAVCVFSEPQFDPKLIETVFGDVAVHGVIDPMGAQLPTGPGHYPQMLRDMAGAFVGCLGGEG